MNKENCTKGPVTVQPLQADEGQSIAIVSAKAGVLATIPPLPEGEKGPEPKEDHANAELIAEAFNVLHETGSPPRALEAALADLVATAKEVECMMDGDRDKQEAWAEELSRLYIALDAAKAAITKYQPTTPA